MGNSTKELINAFNLNNYACDKINTNFTVENKKIVGSFASGTNIEEYLQRIKEEIIKRHYLGGSEVAHKYYHLNCFPFVLGANLDQEYLDNGIVKVKLADSTNNEVIHNLKVHFANEFERAVGGKVAARLQKAGVMEEEAYEWIRGTVKTGAIGSPYLYCIAFSDEYLKRKYDSETFEVLEGMYIQEFNSRLKECHVKSSDFYEYKDDMLCIKDVSDKVVKSVTEHVKKEIAFYLRTPGKEDSKVENFKDVLSSLMSKRVRKFINTYDYDIFTDEKKIQNGDSFVLIPLIEMDDGQFETLSPNDARNIDKMSNKGTLNGFYPINFISDIKGKTASSQFANCKEPVYAISNKGIAQLLPIIMRSPIAYNQISGRFEFAVNLENFRSRHGLLSPEPSRTPPNQRKKDTDSSYDSNSPPKPKDSGAQSSSGGPGPSTEVSDMEWESPTRVHGKKLKRSPRRGTLQRDVSAAEVGAAQNVQAGPSTWAQRTNPCLSQGTSGNKLQPLPFTEPGPSGSSWKDAAQNVQAGTSQPMNPWLLPASSAGLSLCQPSRPSSSKGASERRTSDKPLTEEEKNLFKELLYAFNLNNYTFEYTHTNFIVENGKIASFIGNGVNVKEYLQELRDSTIKDYCVTEKEAYDLNEFPFKFLSNCEKNQETTVVANISPGALSNLKKLFIHEHEKEVKIGDIDIDIVKEGVKSKRSLWVNSEVKSGKSLKVVMPTCYPKESKLKGIPIVKGGSGYSLLHNYPTKEKKPRDATTTFKAIKESKKDDSSSGYSSGFVTDAEKVSSKADAITSSGYESMDYENTRGGSPKRQSPEPLAGSSTTKKTRSESDSSSFEGGVGSPRLGLSGSTIKQVREQLNKTGI